MKRTLIIYTLFLVCIIGVQAKNYVVCVGIADYPGTNNDLHLCAADAQTIKDLYVKNGDAEVVSFTNEQATMNSVINSVKEIFGKASAEDAIVFFFSGHGIPGSFVCYDGFLKYETLTDIMLQSNAESKIVFADACYSGKARQENANAEGSNKSSNVMFFLSSRTGEVSIERKVGWRNGLFTAYLERGLRGGADANKDRTIIARELFLFVSKGVAKESRQKQHPVMWGKFNDNMPVMIWKKK